MPDKLPALEKTGKAWEIGPEVFTVYTDESGEKITRVTIEAQYPGALPILTLTLTVLTRTRSRT